MKTLAPHIRLASMSDGKLRILKAKLQEELADQNYNYSWIVSNPSKCVDTLDSTGWQAHANMLREVAERQTNLFSDIEEVSREQENREYTRSLEVKYDHDLPPVDLDEFDF